MPRCTTVARPSSQRLPRLSSCSSHLQLALRVCLRFEQILGSACVPQGGRLVQRSHASVVAQVGVGVVGQQAQHCIGVALDGGQVQGRPSGLQATGTLSIAGTGLVLGFAARCRAILPDCRSSDLILLSSMPVNDRWANCWQTPAFSKRAVPIATLRIALLDRRAAGRVPAMDASTKRSMILQGHQVQGCRSQLQATTKTWDPVLQCGTR